MIDVILLGCGATMPAPGRGLSSVVLRCRGRSILFDCGEGTQVALQREKVSPLKIDLIALTHYHGDHLFGLPGLLQTMNCLKRTDPLVITGPEGLKEALEPILKLAGQTDYEVRLDKLDAPFGVSMSTLNPKWADGTWFHRFPTAHRVPSQGYSFHLIRRCKFLPEKAKALGVPVSMWKQIIADDPAVPVRINGEILREGSHVVRGLDLMEKPRKGLHVAITGDTMPSRILRSYAFSADLLIHDATYGDNDQEAEAELWGHSTFRQAAEIARDAEVGQLWLTHFLQSIKAPFDYLDNAKAVFPNTVCGYDGLTTTLHFENES